MIKVTRTDAHNFNVQFSRPINDPEGASGSEIPVEVLQSALNYYVEKRQPDGSLSDSDHDQALW